MKYFCYPKAKGPNKNLPFLVSLFLIFLSSLFLKVEAQVVEARRSGFTWITKENIPDQSFGAGFSTYSAAWPIFKNYPGSNGFQMGLGSSWMTTQRSGDEPDDFYTTIEGGLGWWRDTRFGTKVPKFIHGAVSLNFHSWANGPGAGRSVNLGNGQRDWSSSGGKYGVAQLSNRLLWAPDGLNMAQSLNGEMLGYGHFPLPLTEPIEGTGRQCWTLFLNATNFKGPATFVLPTFWTEPILFNPDLEGHLLDTRPSNPNVPLGIEHALSPGLMSFESAGNLYAKIERLQFPANNGDFSMIFNQFSAYSEDALWNNLDSWFNGGPAVQAGINPDGVYQANFLNNGGDLIAEISDGLQNGFKFPINSDYISTVQQNANTMGFEFDLDKITKKDGLFIMPEYFELSSNNKWGAIEEADVPLETNLIDAKVPITPRSQIPYVTPLEPDCAWQDPDGPWNNPGPTAGPFTADMGDGSTLTYYWYRFVDQPAIIHADYPEDVRETMQTRAELLHANWSHTDTYIADPQVGHIATLDPQTIVQPPAGLEVGYVPIVTRQQKTPRKLRVFVLAGQSNMEGFGTIQDAQDDPGSLFDVIANDTENDWRKLGEPGNWTSLENAYIYFERSGGTIKTNVTVGQGFNTNTIGPELMFAHQLDEYFDDPILIIKTAWGGKNLAVDYRPPSAGGTTGPYYNQMIDIVRNVTENLDTEFPLLAGTDFEFSGFAWFQGWNDGETDDFLNEYESNLYHLVNDVRTDLNTPLLPVVIANSGMGGFLPTTDPWVSSIQNIIAVAQEAVGCNDTIYGGTVGFAETKQFYQDPSVSPLNAVYHFNNNALTYLNIGKAIGNEMTLAINDMAFCKQDCEEQVAPGVVSVGNRVWNDLNRDGINDPDEPGIPGVSLIAWSDSDGDNIPDWQGFQGVQVTDEDGYYRFGGLVPGPYVVFVWSLDNWEPDQPLFGFESTNGFVADADNDVDFDNNGFGLPFNDILSGIVILTPDEEPLDDGDPFNCIFDYDGSGNNSVDFGFFNPTSSSFDESEENLIHIFPNPALDEITIQGDLGLYKFEVYDSVGRIHRKINSNESSKTIDISNLASGVYYIKIINQKNQITMVHKVVKQ